ncbi:hypothetical protein FQA47_024668 [Oryzias melastigma]|uniref:Uncharacterized protein n=1 Tax=Oryzias melastigma TaxID=30732 RepID=A0A834F1U1_ORYME|nr:hypothetical protein FQA47_024668 [Oryzias melastigma]
MQTKVLYTNCTQKARHYTFRVIRLLTLPSSKPNFKVWSSKSVGVTRMEQQESPDSIQMSSQHLKQRGSSSLHQYKHTFTQTLYTVPSTHTTTTWHSDNKRPAVFCQ